MGSLNPDLLTTPLHTITEQYGQVGLEQRFQLETERFSTSDQQSLLSAQEYALELHADQRRSREPYANHILRVAIRVMSPHHYGVDEPELVISSLLHDSVEDCKEKIIDTAGLQASEAQQTETALRILEDKYGTRVSTIVEAVTNPPFNKTGDWMNHYREHVEEALLNTPPARVPKVSDFTDNAVGIMYSPTERLAHFATKYNAMTSMFRELIVLPDTPLSERAKTHILGQLALTDDRFKSILATSN